jgi:hypothetical protein
MQDAAYWIFLGLAIFSVILYVVWHKRNMTLLTTKDKRKLSRGASRATQREMRYFWIIGGFVLGLLLLIKLFELHDGFFGAVIFGSLFYSLFRNIWIYRRIKLPEKFVNGEFYLGIIICSFMAGLSYWAFWQK